jgi:hypothetical protein
MKVKREQEAAKKARDNAMNPSGVRIVPDGPNVKKPAETVKKEERKLTPFQFANGPRKSAIRHEPPAIVPFDPNGPPPTTVSASIDIDPVITADSIRKELIEVQPEPTASFELPQVLIVGGQRIPEAESIRKAIGEHRHTEYHFREGYSPFASANYRLEPPPAWGGGGRV